MQNLPLKREAVLAIFGTQAGTKLLNLLGACCGSQPAIQIAFNATCAGVDPKSGEQTYNVTASATYNINISGYTTLIGYLSQQPFPDWTNLTNGAFKNLNLKEGTIFVGNITAGVPVVSGSFVADNVNPGSYYVMLTDNHGNYATPTTITFPNCGKGDGSPAAIPAASLDKTATTG